MAAGKGSRMGGLAEKCHKSLLPINSHENFLSRLLHQINEYEVSKVAVTVGHKADEVAAAVADFQFNYEIVNNSSYDQDTNIWSMKLAMDVMSPDEPIIILEGDVYLDDLAMRDIYNSALKGSSIWFTRGPFSPSQYGGVLKADKDGEVSSIDIVPKYEEKFASYKKLLGITVIGPNEHSPYKQFLNTYASQSKQQYWLVPWYQNLKQLKCISHDLSEYVITSVNTENEYREFLQKLENKIQCPHPLEVLNINKLRPIEGIITERGSELAEKIKKEGVWTKPLFVDAKDFLIMDGHHRYSAALQLGIKRIPVIKLDYKDVPIWSLRADIDVSIDLVKEQALSGEIFPSKTVKHNFKFNAPKCFYELKDLY